MLRGFVDSKEVQVSSLFDRKSDPDNSKLKFAFVNLDVAVLKNDCTGAVENQLIRLVPTHNKCLFRGRAKKYIVFTHWNGFHLLPSRDVNLGENFVLVHESDESVES